MGCNDGYSDILGMKNRLQGYKDLFHHSFLDLRSRSKVFYYSVQLTESQDKAVRDVPNVGYTTELLKVMFTHASKGDVSLKYSA